MMRRVNEFTVIQRHPHRLSWARWAQEPPPTAQTSRWCRRPGRWRTPALLQRRTQQPDSAGQALHSGALDACEVRRLDESRALPPCSVPSLVPLAVLHAVTSPALPPTSRTVPSGVQPTWLPAALVAPGSLKLVTSFGAPASLTSQTQHLPSLDLVAMRCWASGHRQSTRHCPWPAGRGVVTPSALPRVGSCPGTAQATTDPWLVPTNSVFPVS